MSKKSAESKGGFVQALEAGMPKNKTECPPDQATSGDDWPRLIVGIGASAGGLEALERLFEAMPLDTGLCFVVVQHLSPDFKSLTDDILSRRTRLPIHVVEDGVSVRPNTVYLIPRART